jgi:hypothetical protein
VFDLPKLNPFYKEQIKAKFMPDSPYEQLFLRFKYYMSCFDSLPLVQEITEHYKSDPANSKIAELLLATSRCYYDDEHGLKLLKLGKEINQYGPDSLQRINNSIKTPRFIDERVSMEILKKIEKKVAVFEDFDASLFMQLISEMVAFTNAKYPFEKW